MSTSASVTLLNMTSCAEISEDKIGFKILGSPMLPRRNVVKRAGFALGLNSRRSDPKCRLDERSEDDQRERDQEPLRPHFLRRGLCTSRAGPATSARVAADAGRKVPLRRQFPIRRNPRFTSSWRLLTGPRAHPGRSRPFRGRRSDASARAARRSARSPHAALACL